MRCFLVMLLLSCNSASPPARLANHAPAPAAPSTAQAGPEALCCCELHPPESPVERFESRANACAKGTPATPAGTCVDWRRCGFPIGSNRTIADRPDLAAAVSVPTGSCCCDTTDAFRVLAIDACKPPRECLDADWCTPDPRAPAPAATASAAWIDRCVDIADHFEPWRKNPTWASEVSPRARLIADCRAQKWSAALQTCLLAASNPLELDPCMSVQ